MRTGSAESVADLARRLAGRATPQRVAVLEAVLGGFQHRTVQQIHHDCEQRGVRMRLSTVYRVFTILSPSPLPLLTSLVVKNGSKACSSTPRAIPVPVSLTASIMYGPGFTY